MLEYSIGMEDLAAAWERVSENAGCAGCDGVTVERFAHNIQSELAKLLERLRNGKYRPFPLLKIVVEKRVGSAETRQLLVPCVSDRILQTAVARRLSKSFEEEFLECSFAYRPGRSVDRAIARIRKCHEMGYTFVVDADIHSFFDFVDHALLLERIAERETDADLMSLIRQWIPADVWDGERVSTMPRGIAQGSPISPLLANLFLQDFDRELEKTGRKLIRYADDFLILAKTADEAAASLRHSAELLNTLHLELNLDKTRVADFQSGFQFLGAFFNGDATWIPWKKDQRSARVLFMARPLPPALRKRYEDAPRRKTKQVRSSAEPVTPARVRQPERNKPVAFLYLTEQGSVLRKSGDRLLVEAEDEIVLDLPYHKLENIALFGNVQVTTQAVAEILEKGIHLAFFSRQGTFRGSLSAPCGKNIEYRLAQFDQHRDGARALSISRALIQAKIRNGIQVLAGYKRSNKVEAAFDAGYPGLIEMVEAAQGATSIAALEGVEGSAAHQYFSLVMTFNKSAMEWPGRVKHPATDPLNALLSLAYTLLTHELTALLEGMGLDPFLGFLHQPDYGRPSLALDLLEPFRHPVADHFVLNVVNRGQVVGDDFQQRAAGGWFLVANALKRFLRAYEEWMLKDRSGRGGYREIMKREVERFAAALRSNTEFVPFLLAEGDLETECSTLSVTI